MKIIHEQEQRDWKLTMYDSGLVEAVRAVGWRHLYRSFADLDQGLLWCLGPDCLFLAEYEVSQAEQKAAMKRYEEASRRVVENFTNPLGWLFGIDWTKKDENK